MGRPPTDLALDLDPYVDLGVEPGAASLRPGPGMAAPPSVNGWGVLLIVAIDLLQIAAFVVAGYYAGWVWISLAMGDVVQGPPPTPASVVALDFIPLLVFLFGVGVRLAIGTVGGLVAGVVAMFPLNYMVWMPLALRVPGLVAGGAAQK